VEIEIEVNEEREVKRENGDENVAKKEKEKPLEGRGMGQIMMHSIYHHAAARLIRKFSTRSAIFSV
jgi:hypothetical protein